ncbi:hypothetical protein M758_4G041500 [Ceratodon purpureus]|nr:hypothetical protein M758_4G041500 [Ceratodon purpureus]
MYTPDTRIAEHRELKELREQEEKKSERPDSQRKESTRRKGFDPLPVNGRVYQKNEGGWEIKLDESDCGTKIILDVAISKFLDTSLIDIDVQPLLIRVLIKGKLLQLHLPTEVKTDASSAERSLTTGHLVVTMPLVTPSVAFKPKHFPDYYVTGQPKVEASPPQTQVVNIHNITNKEEPPKEPSKHNPRTNCTYPAKSEPEGKQQPPSWTDDVPQLE